VAQPDEGCSYHRDTRRFFGIKIVIDPPDAWWIGRPVIGPDQLVDVGPAILGQIVAGGKYGHLIHYVEFAGEAEQINGKQQPADPERQQSEGGFLPDMLIMSHAKGGNSIIKVAAL
jgi:hypothetical protein